MFESKRITTRILLQVIVTLMVLPYLYPLIVAVQGSLSGSGWGNYEAVFGVGTIQTFFRNSLLIAAGTIVVVYVCTMLAAYGFSKLHIRNKEIYFWMLLIALTLPEVVLLAPLFVTTIRLGLYDTHLAVILPLAALQIPFTVLLTRRFVDGVPTELLEAARVDGANSVRSFWHVILPLTRPIAAAIVLLTLISAWNSYLLPLLFLQDPAKQTVTLLPQYFVSQYTNDQTKVLAAAVIAAVPEIVAYLCLQRLFERGLSAGAVK